jgi:hypothetical protein
MAIVTAPRRYNGTDEAVVRATEAGLSRSAFLGHAISPQAK